MPRGGDRRRPGAIDSAQALGYVSGMAEDIQFSNNYRDLCRQSGTGAGFQFEFYCESCADTWRSPFDPYRSGQASSWLREAGSFLGNVLGGIGSTVNDAADGFAQAGWGTSRDAAFKRAIEVAKGHFNRCAQCHDYMCGQCWSIESGLCVRCAPDIAVEVQKARHAGTFEAARDAAHEAGVARADKVDIQSDHQLMCPECGAQARGAKFCPQCGHGLNVAAHCSGCRSEMPAGSRFCPDCGKAAA
jgi:hypothetical protein